MEKSDSEKARRGARSQLFMAAAIEFGGRQIPVKLRNLSSEGALIEATDLPIDGTEILFRRNELSVPARVAWSADGKAGLAFATELSPETVLRHVPQPRSRTAVEVRRPGFRKAELSEGERRFAEEYVFGRAPNAPKH